MFGISEESKSLLKAMLKSDDTKRPSALECLNHPFIKNNEIKMFIDRVFIENCLINFMKYTPEMKFHQAIMAYIVHHFYDQNDILEYKNLFYLLDNNKDGKLSHFEILNGFKIHLGLKNDKEYKDLIKITKKIDTDKSGFIEFEEFLLAVMKKEIILSDEKIQKLFKMFDMDQGGSITSGEIKYFLGNYAKISEKNWNEIVNQIEIRNPHEITLEEFKYMMKLIFKKK